MFRNPSKDFGDENERKLELNVCKNKMVTGHRFVKSNGLAFSTIEATSFNENLTFLLPFESASTFSFTFTFFTFGKGLHAAVSLVG